MSSVFAICCCPCWSPEQLLLLNVLLLMSSVVSVTLATCAPSAPVPAVLFLFVVTAAAASNGFCELLLLQL